MEGAQLNLMSMTFDVPWAALCSDNRKYVTRFILSKAYRASKTMIAEFSIVAAAQQKWLITEHDLGLRVTVREPDKRRRDFNWSKNLKDGITEGAGVWVDDSQVRVEQWEFDKPDKANAGATIHIWRLDA
jgi:Holliday junction resolvase RusA-like endonuclease